MSINRFDVYLVNLDPTRASEIRTLIHLQRATDDGQRTNGSPTPLARIA
jgi:hypothetical protein